MTLTLLDVRLIFDPNCERFAELDEYQPSFALAIIGVPGSIISYPVAK
jgi:hypothetical protein